METENLLNKIKEEKLKNEVDINMNIIAQIEAIKKEIEYKHNQKMLEIDKNHKENLKLIQNNNNQKMEQIKNERENNNIRYQKEMNNLQNEF